MQNKINKNENILTLFDIKKLQFAYITKIKNEDIYTKRLNELGVKVNAKIQKIATSLDNQTILFFAENTLIAISKELSKNIEVRYE